MTAKVMYDLRSLVIYICVDEEYRKPKIMMIMPICGNGISFLGPLKPNYYHVLLNNYKKISPDKDKFPL